MDESAGSRKKITVLQEALDQIRPQFPAARIIAFNSTAQEMFESLPEPDGSTALHYALEYGRQYRPRHTIVISDGQPDDEAAALEAAEKLTGIIDVVYCGPDSDKEAIAFMHRLARSAGGRVVRTDWGRTNGHALAPTVRQLLLKA
jgi:Mg-chelatase subunit ChlD